MRLDGSEKSKLYGNITLKINEPALYSGSEEDKDKVKLVLKNLSDGTEKIIPTSQIVSYEYDDEMQIFGDTLYVSSEHFRNGADIDTSEHGFIPAAEQTGVPPLSS